MDWMLLPFFFYREKLWIKHTSDMIIAIYVEVYNDNMYWRRSEEMSRLSVGNRILAEVVIQHNNFLIFAPWDRSMQQRKCLHEEIKSLDFRRSSK